MPVSRRQFIAGSIAGTISTLLYPAGAQAASRFEAAGAVQSQPNLKKQAGEKITLETIQASHFKACLNSTFQVSDESGAGTTLELVEVAERSMPKIENFSLIFRGPAEFPLAQQIYRFRHGQLGELSMFIVPIGCAGGEMRYEAIFNRLVG